MRIILVGNQPNWFLIRPVLMGQPHTRHPAGTPIPHQLQNGAVTTPHTGHQPRRLIPPVLNHMTRPVNHRRQTNLKAYTRISCDRRRTIAITTNRDTYHLRVRPHRRVMHISYVLNRAYRSHHGHLSGSGKHIHHPTSHIPHPVRTINKRQQPRPTIGTDLRPIQRGSREGHQCPIRGQHEYFIGADFNPAIHPRDPLRPQRTPQLMPGVTIPVNHQRQDTRNRHIGLIIHHRTGSHIHRFCSKTNLPTPGNLRIRTFRELLPRNL